MTWKDLKETDIIWIQYWSPKYEVQTVSQEVVLHTLDDYVSISSNWYYFVEHGINHKELNPELLEVYRYNEQKDIFENIFKLYKEV